MEILHLTHGKVLEMLPDRKAESHKGNYGKILLLCGSVGYTGAPALAAMGALRSGAGLVFLGVPASIYAIEAVKLLEPIVFPVGDEEGKFSSVTDVENYLQQADAVLIGPGIGRSERVCQFAKYVLTNYNGPVVLDADGISLMAQHKDILRGRTAPTILTPHEGEFRRIAELSDDRVESAIRLAQDIRSVVVLKGHRTVITDGNEVYVNLTGNPGMAVGGSGDVLAGVILSLLGQGLPPLQAAACGVWLHGAAGDLCAKELGQYGMLPSDMLTMLPRLMK